MDKKDKKRIQNMEEAIAQYYYLDNSNTVINKDIKFLLSKLGQQEAEIERLKGRQSEVAEVSDYLDILTPAIAGTPMCNMSLIDFANKIKVRIIEESKKPNCDTWLISLLIAAAGIGWENICLVKMKTSEQ